jgi:hypothetical protein
MGYPKCNISYVLGDRENLMLGAYYGTVEKK